MRCGPSNLRSVLALQLVQTIGQALPLVRNHKATLKGWMSRRGSRHNHGWPRFLEHAENELEQFVNLVVGEIAFGSELEVGNHVFPSAKTTFAPSRALFG